MDDLQRLLAERACERLINEYARRVDFGEAAAIADLFTEDARWEGHQVFEGQARIREWFEGRQGVSRRVSRHVCTNALVEVLSPTAARSRCYMINYRHDREEGDDSLPVPTEVPKYVGELEDEFRLTDEGWRFSRRRVSVAFQRPRKQR